MNKTMKILALLAMAAVLQAAEPLRLGIVGLEHGHVTGFLRRGLSRPDVRIVGIAEANAEVAARYVTQFKLDPSLIYSSLEEMLDSER